LLHIGDAAGHGDDEPGLGEGVAAVHLLDEVAQHLLGDVELGDDPVGERADRDDVTGRSPDHLFGLRPHRDDLPRSGVDRDHGRLVEDDATVTDVHEGVRRAEVDRHVAAEEPKEGPHEPSSPGESALCGTKRGGRLTGSALAFNRSEC